METGFPVVEEEGGCSTLVGVSDETNVEGVDVEGKRDCRVGGAVEDNSDGTVGGRGGGVTGLVTAAAS